MEKLPDKIIFVLVCKVESTNLVIELAENKSSPLIYDYCYWRIG
jgi:hypothetical protein